jgi:hypothetical protein
VILSPQGLLLNVKELSTVKVLAPSEGTGKIGVLLFLNLGPKEPFAYKVIFRKTNPSFW